MTDLYFDIKQKAEENNATAKEYLLLVPQEEQNEAGVTLLKAIIGALKLDIDRDFDLIFVPNSGLSLGRKLSAYKKVLILGCKPDDLDLQLEEKKYKLLYPEGQQILFGDAPSVLSGDTAKKGLLWKCLQHMFDLVKA
jgi:hypothetical protein